MVDFKYSYIVCCELPSTEIAEDWVEWLRGGHMQDMIEIGGAETGELIRVGELSYQARYVFPSEASFKHYMEEIAPKLRGEGVKKFPASMGLKYSRMEGPVLFGRSK
eukprot:Nk52_evm92s226 gene=Nk52_evmTU92s226